ncbi:phosphotransferase family protein [Nocardioides pacificus]
MSTPVIAQPVVSEPSQLTASWLTGALRAGGHAGARVDHVTVERVGSGQMASCYAVRLVGDGVPARLLAKLPNPDPAARPMAAGAYRKEVQFYAEIAPTVEVRTAQCHYGAMDEESSSFTLLLEDLSPAVQGDQVAGCTPEQARAAAVNLAGLHGPRWCDPSLLDIDGYQLSEPEDAELLAGLAPDALHRFLDALGDRLDENDRQTLADTMDVIAAWSLGRTERFGLVHGDYRLDNMLYSPTSGEVTAVDWQTLSLGLPARDLAFFVGTGLSIDDRRRHEHDLVAAYHAALTSYGVEGHSLDECWDDYRFSMLQGPLISVFGCAYGTRTARGDDMFVTMVQRSCAAVRDLGTLDLV